MKVVAILINFFVPGIGSFFIKQIGQGIVQFILWFIGVVLTMTAIGAIIGIPLMLGAWIWGLVSAGTYNEKPQVINVIHTQQPATLNEGQLQGTSSKAEL